jgi:hypothetical protein
VLCSKKQLSCPLDCGGSDRLSDTFDDFADFADFVSTSSILPLKLVDLFLSDSLRCAMRRILSTWAYKSMKLSSSEPSSSIEEGFMLAIFEYERTNVIWIESNEHF